MLKSESFLELRWPLMLALVREGELQVDEADLFKAVQAWVSRNSAERRRYVDEVRCGGLLCDFGTGATLFSHGCCLLSSTQ